MENEEPILHKQGAEAKIFFYKNYAIKQRISKSYRIKEIDDSLIKKRTKVENKIIQKLNKQGLNVPKLYNIKEILINYDFRITNTILMEKIEGPTLKEYFENALEEDRSKTFKIMGKLICQIHNLNVIHGDITTMNFIVNDDDIFIIDFGLSFISSKEEDKAVDLYVFEKSLICTQNERYIENFYSGYENKAVLERLEKVKQRGRKREENAIG